jgi:hypothetical protein
MSTKKRKTELGSEVTVFVNGIEVTGDCTSWTPEDFSRLSQMFKDAGDSMRWRQHIHLNCDGESDDPDQFAPSFCFISIEQPHGGNPYVKEYSPPASLDMKKLIRERSRRMDGKRQKR